MISDPCKIHYNDDYQKNFSFRPIMTEKKENIKIKQFETDKTRVEKYLQSHKEELKKYDLKHNKSKSSINSDYLQPIMKFTARTDLERIFDSVNLNYFGKIDREIIHNQLKSLGLLTVRNIPPKYPEEYSLLKEKLRFNPQTLTSLIKEKRKIEKGPKTPETKDLLKNMVNVIQINKKILTDKKRVWGKEHLKSKSFNRRKNLNNKLAKNILSEYQKKTHFKAIISCSLGLNNIDSNDNNTDFNKKYCLSIDNDKDKSSKNKSHKYSKSVKNLDSNKSNIDQKYNSLHTESNNSELRERIKITNDYNKTCINSLQKKKVYSKEKMDYLRGLFMKTNKNNDENDNHLNNNEDEEEARRKIQQMNNVIIDGKYYNKKDIVKISNAVLKECNYIKKYFGSEKAGDSKTMITRGMTVNEFTKKYNLPK